MLSLTFQQIETKHDAYDVLANCGSHAAFNREEADAICKPFGFTPRLHKEKANTDPKGYLNEKLKKGETVEVTGGWLLAEQIANHLNLTYDASPFGRGRIFWNAMGAIKTHIDDEKAFVKKRPAKRSKKGASNA